MKTKETLKETIRNGSSLLEIIGENIDLHAEIYTDLYYAGKKRTKAEIIKIVIDDLNNELKLYDQCKVTNKTSD